MKKGQTALEYLMTYGWAILIIVIVGAALYALGVFSPGTFSAGKACLGFSELGYQDHAFKTDGTVTIKVTSPKSAIAITGITMSGGGTGDITGTNTSVVTGDISISSGGDGTIASAVTAGTGKSLGDTYSKLKVTIAYIAGDISHTDTATCNGKYE